MKRNAYDEQQLVHMDVDKVVNNNQFKMLPTEIWFCILSFLKARDLASIRQVNRFYCELTLLNPFVQMIKEFQMDMQLLRCAQHPVFARAYSTSPDIQKQLKRAQSEYHEFQLTLTPQ